MCPASSSICLVLAQLDFTVGDLDGNAAKIIQAGQQAQREFQADMLVFPEQALIGYPAEDLLLQAQLPILCEQAIDKIAAALPKLCLILGYPRAIDELTPKVTNHALVLYQDKRLASYAKQYLPNYQVFDEKRYFEAGTTATTFLFKEVTFGLLICEDLWYPHPIAACRAAGAQHIISLNASPYNIQQPQQRMDIIVRRAREQQLPISYVNCCGGQDELVFDGHSFVCSSEGDIITRLPGMQEGLLEVGLDEKGVPQALANPAHPPPLTKTAEIYQVLQLGLRDYIIKNGFTQAVLGLSGGIDSALVLCLAADALGADKVTALIMPSMYTASMSTADAIALAENLGVRYEQIAVQPMVDSCLKQLNTKLSLGDKEDTTVQNIQPRCRSLLLMAWSNRTGALLLATGNKSENAVGYATLYGDMAGGFSPIKDVLKTRVYELARYRNSIRDVIPERILTRPPSAELYPDQLDRDSLPDYPILDEILTAYIEEALSHKDIIARGYDKETTIKVISMVDASEYKRQQAAPGTRITEKGFGKDRRYPITNKYAHSLSQA